MKTDKDLERYEDVTPKELELIPEISSYNHNYYKGLNGDILYADRHDDCCTDWHLVEDDEIKNKRKFGYSLI